MSMSKLTGKRPLCSSSSSEERGDGSQPQDKRRHQTLPSDVLDAINEKVKEGIQPVVEDASGKVISILVTMIENQSHELRNLESIVKDQAEQMAEMQAQNSALKCQSDKQRSDIRDLTDLIIVLMGQQNEAPENPAMVTETQIEELRRMNPEDAMPLESRRLELHFTTELSSPLYTCKQIKGVEGATIHIALIDANTGNVVESGPEASIKLDAVVLKGDFNKDNSNDWTREEFERCQMRPREGKVPLLAGNLQVTLKRGVGELGNLRFTDNSRWHRSHMFRIGLKVAPGYCEGSRIREAITEALRVKEQRGELYEKQYPAKPDDEVWRLKNIAKDGVYHTKLKEIGVVVVEDFLREYVRDGKSLRNVLGGGMPETKWNVLIDHAKSCAQSGKLYRYSYDEAMNHAIVFDITGQLKAYIDYGDIFSADSLSHEDKEDLKKMVTKAYNDWEQVKDFKIQSNSMHNPVSDISPTAAFCGQQDYPNLFAPHLTSNTLAPFEFESATRVFEGNTGTEVGGSFGNVPNDNLSVAAQNPLMNMENLPEVPLHQNSAPTERHLPSPAFHGPTTSSVHLHGDQGSTEKFCSTLPQDDNGTKAQMSASDYESIMGFLMEESSPVHDCLMDYSLQARIC